MKLFPGLRVAPSRGWWRTAESFPMPGKETSPPSNSSEDMTPHRHEEGFKLVEGVYVFAAIGLQIGLPLLDEFDANARCTSL